MTDIASSIKGINIQENFERHTTDYWADESDFIEDNPEIETKSLSDFTDADITDVDLVDSYGTDTEEEKEQEAILLNSIAHELYDGKDFNDLTDEEKKYVAEFAYEAVNGGDNIEDFFAKIGGDDEEEDEGDKGEK